MSTETPGKLGSLGVRFLAIDHRSRDEVERVAAVADAAPHALEHLPALLFLLLPVLRGVLLALIAVAASPAVPLLARRLLNVQFLDGDALGFEGGLEALKALGEEARGLVVRRLEGRREDAVPHFDPNLER